MELNLILDANKIYKKEFEGNKPGYDALQVDSFLDLVIKDYETIAKYQNEVNTKISELNSKIELLTKKLSQEELKSASLQNQMSGISNSTEMSLNNLEYIKRISKLEEALSKAGINPNSVE